MRLKEKVAIVTGGGSGLGRAISMAFASEGAAVVLVGRTLSKLEETAKEIRYKGGMAEAIQADVSNEGQVQQMVSETVQKHSQVDILVNSAGVSGPTANVVDMSLDDWNAVLAINLTGGMLCAREVLRGMIPRRSGNIINISGSAGTSGYPMRSSYCATKWGVIGLTKTLAIEVGEYNIRVNSISPAAIKGERLVNVVTGKARATGVSFEELMSKITANYSLKRPVEESEVSAAAVFLASDESSAITDQNLVVNCGQHMIL